MCERPDLPRRAETRLRLHDGGWGDSHTKGCGRIVLWRLTGTGPGSSLVAGAGRRSSDWLGESQDGVPGRRHSSHRREGLVAELAQAVVHPSSDLSSNRERRPLGTEPLTNAEVVLVVWSGGLGG